jgi:site-specific DNA-cytosine methylase
VVDTSSNVLSLCSGIGGLDLGVKLALPGARVLAYVEREAYAAAVLLAHVSGDRLRVQESSERDHGQREGGYIR